MSEISKVGADRGGPAGFADNLVRISRQESRIRNFRKKYLKPVVEETSGRARWVAQARPAIRRRQSTKFRSDLKISLNDKQNSL